MEQEVQDSNVEELSERLKHVETSLKEQEAANNVKETEFEQEIEGLNDEVEELTARLREAQLALAASNRENEELASELDDCRDQIAALEELKLRLTQTLKYEQDQRETLCKLMKETRDETTDQFNEEMQYMEKEHEQLKNEIGRLKSEAKLHSDKYKDKLALLEKDKLLLKVKLDDSNVAMTALTAKLESQVKQTERHRINELRLKQRVDQLEKQVRKGHRSDNTTSRHLQQLELRNKQLETTLQDKDQTIECLKQEIEALADRFQASARRITQDYDQQLSTQDQTIASLHAKIELLTSHLDKKEKLYVSQGSILQTLDSTLDRLIKK